jgi:hypothetical protein
LPLFRALGGDVGAVPQAAASDHRVSLATKDAPQADALVLRDGPGTRASGLSLVATVPRARRRRGRGAAGRRERPPQGAPPADALVLRDGPGTRATLDATGRSLVATVPRARRRRRPTRWCCAMEEAHRLVERPPVVGARHPRDARPNRAALSPADDLASTCNQPRVDCGGRQARLRRRRPTGPFRRVTRQPAPRRWGVSSVVTYAQPKNCASSGHITRADEHREALEQLITRGLGLERVGESRAADDLASTSAANHESTAAVVKPARPAPTPTDRPIPAGDSATRAAQVELAASRPRVCRAS